MVRILSNARRERWLLIALIWLGVGLIDAGQTVFPMRAQGMHHAWIRLFVTLTIAWLPWALATPLVVQLGRRYPLLPAPAWPAIAAHLAALGAISLVSAAWSTVLEVVLDPWEQAGPSAGYVALWLTRFTYGLLTSLIVYAFIVALTVITDSKARLARQHTETAQLNEQLSKAQLEGLRQQMEPHFLFNTLNAITGLVREHKNDEAVSMIVALSALFRRTALGAHRPLVTLAEEVTDLQRFVDILKLRFADRFQFSMDIPATLSAMQVPSLLLQPLVENAIKHGIAKRVAGGAIRIAGTRSGDRLCLRIVNDGAGAALDPEASRAGIGLANLRARLGILYGADFELELRNSGADEVEVRVSLPLREA